MQNFQALRAKFEYALGSKLINSAFSQLKLISSGKTMGLSLLQDEDVAL